MEQTITAPTAPRKRWQEPEDQLTSSFFQQPQNAMAPAAAVASSTSPAGTATPAAPRPRTAAPAQQASTPPGGNLNFSSLVGASAPASPQRVSAPPLADQSAPAAPPTRIDHRTYQPPGGGTPEAFFAQLQPGTPVEGSPGRTWQHDGQGWIQTAGGTPPWNPTQGGGTEGPNTDPRFSWMQSTPYTPGDIGTDDLDFSWQDPRNAMPDYVPTNVSGSGYQSQDVGAEDFDPYEFGGWSGLPGMDVGALEGLTDDAIRRMLENPESLDPRTVDMMKAASREEQSALQGQEAEELRAMGFDLGVDDSPWLQSTLLESRRGRDNAVIAGNRSIDIDAAKTNAGDRRAAAALGASYVDSKSRTQIAKRAQEFGEQAEGERNKQTSAASKQSRAEYLTGVKTGNADRALESAKLRTQADIANNQNMFNAAKLRQDKVLGTVDADLRRAAATTDRLSLREQVGQAAAELGISRDKLMSDWLQALMDDATQRYGIDVAASVDREKLAQAGGEFKEDLAFRIMALETETRFKYDQLGESGRQFDYGLGLSYGELFENARQHDDDMYGRSQGF
jgi:hypothetical protein